MTDHVDAVGPERRILRQLAFDAHDLAAVFAEDDTAVDQRDVLSLWLDQDIAAPGPGRFGRERVVVRRQFGPFGLVGGDELPLTLEQRPEHFFPDRVRSALANDLVAEALGV